MASPVGHGLLVSVLGVKQEGRQLTVDWRVIVLLVFASVAPDLDLFVGLLLGDVNRFHRGPSHSLTASLGFGLAVIPVVLLVSSRWKRYAVLGTIGYASHLFLDFFTWDGSAPYGQPLLWPFSNHYFESPWVPLGGIRHGDPGQSISVVFSEIFSWSNVLAVGKEVVFVAPLVMAILFLRRLSLAGQQGRSPHDDI